MVSAGFRAPGMVRPPRPATMAKAPGVPALSGHPGMGIGAPMKGFGGGPSAGLHYLPQGGGGMNNMSRGFSTGGVVGYAKGGEVIHHFNAGNTVPGKGNTDTVPAMLTPGEFVVRKASAQAHKGLLKRINESDGGPVHLKEGGEVKVKVKVKVDERPRGDHHYKTGGTVTIGPEHKGQEPIHFKKGALHRELGVPESQKIPAKKMAAARSGALGPLAKKRANFAKNVLTGGR